MKEEVRKVIAEIERVFLYSQIDFKDFRDRLCSADKIVCVGAGRVGLVMDAFAKRLVHLGFSAYSYWDVNLPRVGTKDVLLVGSGSGNTKSIAILAQIAKQSGVSIALVTANMKSTIGEIADTKLIINCPHKESHEMDWKSSQPMTTLFEQSLYVLLDSLVLNLMSSLQISEVEMKSRHNVIE
jgi:6-phospho-3-hexuloisomerase